MYLEETLKIDGMNELRNEALSRAPESISDWAQYLLECETHDEEFMAILQKGEVELPWIGELACCLLKVRELRASKSIDGFNTKEKKEIEDGLFEAIVKLAEEQRKDYSFLKDGTINFDDRDVFPALNGDNFSALSDSTTISILRELAHSNYAGAQYLLAIGGDEQENWIAKALENKYLLAMYRLGFGLYEEQPEKSIRELERFIWHEPENKDGIDLTLLALLKEESHNQILKLTTHLTEERARIDEQKMMLSFLAHTLTNSVAGTTDTVRRIAKSLIVPDGEGIAIRKRASERLVGLMTSFALTESLVSTFKLYVTDPQSLRRAWEHDVDGEVPLRRLIALSVRQSLSRFFFTAEHAHDFARLLRGRDHREVSNDFIENALTFDMNDDEQVEQFLGWVSSKLPFFSLQIYSDEDLFVTRAGAKYVLIFSLISELLTNSIKYSAGAVDLRCDVNKGKLSIRSINPVFGQLNQSKSGKKGIQFIGAICSLIGGNLSDPKIENGSFMISASVPMS